MDKFNEIKTRNDLACFLKTPIQKLTYILYKKGIENYYISFEIPKKSGGVRCINAPQEELKEVQKNLAEALWEYQKEFQKEAKIQSKVSHAFEKSKGIITNAEIHRNKKFVLNLDLENFFDSFHFGRVRGFFEKNRNFQLPIEVATILAQLTCYQGKLPQGAPSSPIITNLICNILDVRLMKIAQKYKVDYTRYADDITFSTNEKSFFNKQEVFLNEVKKEINKSGFLVNEKKTRLLFRDSRQEVTGLVVNKKINVPREYYKKTRAMANTLYKHGEFKIDDSEGKIRQLEGRFSFINQLDRYNNKIDGKKHNVYELCAREKQYQKFLFYKYFYANEKPIVVTEGKTDIQYIKAALKKYHKDYPNLIVKKDKSFEFKCSFLRKTPRLEYFMGIQQDGADTMKNIYNLYCGKSGFPNLYEYFQKKCCFTPKHPVILVFDNEQESGRPLKKFLDYIKNKQLFKEKRYASIIANVFALTNPLVDNKKECEIEDLFDEAALSTIIGGRKFSRDANYNPKTCYGKADFADYISSNYNEVDFMNFKPMLNDLNAILEEYGKG